MKVNTIVESTVGQINKVSNGNGHLFTVQFGLEGAHAGFKSGNFRHDGGDGSRYENRLGGDGGCVGRRNVPKSVVTNRK